MARLKAATRTSIPSDQTGAFDQIVQERGSIPELGPIGAMIHVPELTQRGEVLREYLRGDLTSLPAQTRELAMILTAREMDCQYIWHAHAGFARESGLSDELVNNLRDKKDLPTLSTGEDAVINYGREFFRTHKVTQKSFDAALACFGVRGLVELTNLMGYYAALAFNVNAFEMEIPEDSPEIPLPV